MSKVAVLIPCYNEESTVGDVVSGFRKVLPDAEIYVYDNASTDATAAKAIAAGAIVRKVPMRGKGRVVRAMFRDINADCYIMVDGDNTYPPEAAKDMVRMVVDEKADMVIGDRLSSTYFTENKRRFHNSGNNLVKFIVNRAFKGNITDIMTGYRAFGFEFVKTFPVLSKGFEIETEMTIHALDKDLLVKSLPIQYRDRPTGSTSKLNTFQDGARVIKTIATLYAEYKPLRFFGTFAFVFLLMALVFLAPVLIEYLRSGLVPQFPTFIAAGIFVILSLLSFVCGVILQTVVSKHRQLFEVNRNIIKLFSEPR